MTAYLDKLNRKVEVAKAFSPNYMALVLLKDGVNWKSFNTMKIPPSRDKDQVEKALAKFAKENGLKKI